MDEIGGPPPHGVGTLVQGGDAISSCLPIVINALIASMACGRNHVHFWTTGAIPLFKNHFGFIDGYERIMRYMWIFDSIVDKQLFGKNFKQWIFHNNDRFVNQLHFEIDLMQSLQDLERFINDAKKIRYGMVEDKAEIEE
ncbi:hypothetical protein RFI_34031 [Reticulomyxa filosa]|uniref:Uncharacterized protein n=1 Tax=Reticulomyxa filosa TaxID=46433 RepID=X6LP62_RETFI|nr:hypothetical protein RFI_34031 [Reticulomyxa filosa]|eukprot:ETO03379.1 hypothetical protein RFI_34031 [Reticulomyxa filosa]